MRISCKIAFAVIGTLFCTFAASAQSARIPETHNAALRYWIAFADLQDSAIDKSTQELLERTAAGEIPWDEAKLGEIVEKNEDAILGMQRATSLPDCDWGLEYSRGPRASIAYMMKARILARLNTLYGFRQAARGDSGAAMRTWLAGLKFSQDLAKGGTLIFVLVARTALLSNLNAIRISAERGALHADDRKQALSAMQMLPQTGFGWGDSWNLETFVIEVGWDSTLKAHDPREEYKAITGNDWKPEFHLPSPGELRLFGNFMGDVAEALKLPPEETTKRIAPLRDREKTLNPLLQDSIPDFAKVNAARQEVQASRDAALKAVRKQ